jgi:hypothetical protein
MKKLLFTLTLACALALGGNTAFAQAKKKKDAAAPAEAAAEKPKAGGDTGAPKSGGDTAKPKAEGEAAKPKRDTIPMNVRVDEIDESAKTITQVNKDGKKSVNTVTATTEIKNGDKAAAFGDIKKGDWIGGLRKKTGENAYEVVKITKFGPKAEKAEGEAKKPEGEGKKPAAEAKKK